MTMVSGRIADRTVAEEYFAVTAKGQLARQTFFDGLLARLDDQAS
jgi:hypothetical protein